MSNRVVHFEIHAENPQRASKFYSDVFGWKIEKWDGPFDYWMVMTGDKGQPGINGGMLKREGSSPRGDEAVIAYTCSITVDDVDAYIDKVKQHGGTIVMEKQSVEGVGDMATCKDTEGNLFGLYREKM